MNLADFTDEEIDRARDVLLKEHSRMAKNGVIGPSNSDTVAVAIWVIAALLRMLAAEKPELSPPAPVQRDAP